MRPKLILFTLISSLIIFLLTPGGAANEQKLVVDVNLTLLTVRVHDPHGRPVPNLTSEDFEIFEAGESRPPSHFAVQRYPMSAGLLVDRSVSVGNVRNAVAANIVRICNAFRPDDKAFLMTFSTGTKIDVPLTYNHKSIVSAAHRLKTEPGTRLYDAMIDALDELARSKSEHKALIVLTDGADHYSKHNLRQVLDVAHLYDVEIDIIAYKGDDRRSWTASGRAEISHELEQMTSATGGRLLSASNGPQSAATLEEMVDSLHNVYQIGFYSSVWSGEPPRIDVRIRNHPEWTVFPAL
jgi:Ca-activated chloride channel homolog